MKKTAERIFFSLFILLFFNCKSDINSDKDLEYVPAVSEIKNKALEYARLYEQADTVYEWGGQDSLRALKIDCSGLVYMCYQYAIENTGYKMIADDMSSAYMTDNCYPTDSPDPGDLIFMGEENSSSVTHVALFVRQENENIYFIDSTENDTVSGVSERFYDSNNKKFKGFGIMKLYQKH